MPIVTFKILNKAGTLSHDSLEVASGTQWTIASNKITVGSTQVVATPITAWEFTGNWGQPSGTTTGTITGDTTFNADFINMNARYSRSPEGQVAVYSILSYKNINYCIDNYGNETDQDNQINLYTRNYTGAQDFLLLPGEDTYHSRIRGRFNLGYLYANSTTPLLGQELRLHSGAYSTGEIDWRFLNQPTFMKKINGVNYRAQDIDWKANTNYRVDNASGAIQDWNRIQLYTNNGTQAQMWIPMKAAQINDNYAIPKIQPSEKKPAINLNQKKNVTLSLTGSTNFQTRMRKRTLSHNTNSWSEWSNWESPNGLNSDEGWGDAWSHNAVQTNIIEVEGANTTSSIDAIEYSIDARSFSLTNSNIGKLPFASHSANMHLTTRQKTTSNLVSITYTSHGLIFKINTNVYRKVNKTHIYIQDIYIGDKKLADNYLAESLSPSSEYEVSIPLENLNFKPEEGDTVNLVYTINYQDNYIVDFADAVSSDVIYDGGSLTPVIAVDYISPYDVGVTIVNSGLDYKEVKLEYEHNGEVVVRDILPDESISSNYRIPSPLNTAFDVYVFIQSHDGWGAKRFKFRETLEEGDFRIIKTNAIVVNGYKQELVMQRFTDSLPFESSTDCNLESVQLNGKKYEDYFYTGTISTDVKVNGAVLNKYQKRQLDIIKMDGFCVLRDNKGGFYNAAIKSVDIDNHMGEYVVVSLTFSEANHEIDITWPTGDDANVLDW